MNNTKIKKIAIIRALYLGDMLCAVPAFRALRKGFPDAEISLIGLSWAESFVKKFNSYLDIHVPIPGYPGLVEQAYNREDFSRFLKKVRNEKFDLVIQLHGSGELSNQLVSLFEGKITLYSSPDGVTGNFASGISITAKYRRDLAEIRRNIEIINALGTDKAGENLEYSLPAKTKLEFASDVPYACVHPGARDPKRRWEPEKFAYVADKLSRAGYRIVITGVKDERILADKVAAGMSIKPLIYTGKLNLDDTAQLVKSASLVLTNCTSISHLADAFNTPSIVIFKNSDPQRWAPLDKKTA